MYFDPVLLQLVLATKDGNELVAATIAHELAHSLHIARGLHVNKHTDQVEAEVDAITINWGFSGGVRGWIEEHLRVG